MKYKWLNLKYALVNCTYMLMVCATVGYTYNFLSQSGFRDSATGIIIMLVSIAGLIGQTASGAIIDKSDRIDERTFIAGSLVIVMVFCVILQFMPEGSLALAAVSIICFTAASLGMPFLNTIAFIYENDGQKINYGVCRGLGSGAWAVGSSIIGQLWARMGKTVMPWYVLICAAVTMVLILWMPKASESAAASAKEGGKDSEDLSYKAFFTKYRGIIIVAVSLVLLYVSHMFVNTYIAKVIGNIIGADAGTPGAVEAIQGTALFIAAILELPTMFLFSKIAEKFSIEQIMAFSAIAWTVKHILTWLCTSVPMFYAVMGLQMFSYALIVPACVYYANDSVEENDKNKSQAIFGATFTVGTLIASFLGGQLFELTSVSTVLFIGALISVAGAVLMVIGMRNSAKKHASAQ